MNDDTRVLRNAQANLISIQAMRIAKLEAQLEEATKIIEDLQAENKALAQKQVVRVNASNPKVDC